MISGRLCIEYGNTQMTGNYMSDDGKTKVNQDSRVSLKNLFAETLSREDLPDYQLHLLSDGHGASGHVISNFIIEKYPVILAQMMLAVVTEVQSLEFKNIKEAQPLDEVQEEEHEDD